MCVKKAEGGGVAIKRSVSILCCITALCFTCACFNRREAKTLAVVQSIIYDLNDDGSYHTVTEILNPAAESGGGGGGGGGGGSGGGKSATITLDGYGDSPVEALFNSAESLERVIFGGHNNVRFFSEKLARNDVIPVMDYFARDHLTDETPYMFVIKDEQPDRIYRCMLGLSDTVGDFIQGISDSQPDIMANAAYVTTLDFFKGIYDEGKEPVMGLVELVECDTKGTGEAEQGEGTEQQGEKKYRVKVEGLAAFRDNKLAGYFNAEETRAYNILTGEMKSARITVKRGDERNVVEVLDSSAGIKAESAEGRVKFNVAVKMKLEVTMESGYADIRKEDVLKAVEKRFNEDMKREITAAVTKAQKELKSDIFGFGSALHAQYPKQWEKLKLNWNETFSGAEITVDVQSTVTLTGEIKQPFRSEE